MGPGCGQRQRTLKIPALIKVLEGQTLTPPPVWMMRQAGRYLPEYRKLREKMGGFLEMCYTPEVAAEITLQPIKRFDLDAAILFSDILVIPDAMGQAVRFEEGVGPLLEPLGIDDVDRLDDLGAMEKLAPVLRTVSLLAEQLPQDTALIGFCGAPWTVATYMIAGRGTPDQMPARTMALQAPDRFGELIDKLVALSVRYLVGQLRSGADCVQIFDSWAGILSGEQFERWCVDPVRLIVDGVRSEVADAKIIGFPKGANNYLENYREMTGVDALGLDWTVPLTTARKLQRNGPVQGNLDPARLIAGGAALDQGVDDILEGLGEGPHIFNLGHGITPQTPVSHVERMVRRIRSGPRY